MANRPAFTFQKGSMRKMNINFTFNPGFADCQKKKNIAAMHQNIRDTALEVSTKSDVEIGRKCSAFALKLDGAYLECVYQAGKVYEKGGPYLDLLEKTPREAKRDPRHETSGKLIGFRYKDIDFPLEPTTLFYDYLYCKAVQESIPKEELMELLDYNYFTDIEFNPKRSTNTQARSIAIVKAFMEFYGEIPDLSYTDDFKIFSRGIRVPRTV